MIDPKIYGEFTTSWCPGCGNHDVLLAVKDALASQDLLPHQFVMVSGIGQAAKIVHYLKCNGFNGLHGRALSPAQAIKLAHPEMTVLVDFGWRQGRAAGAEVRREQRRETGGHAVRFHFLGTANLRYDHFFQYVAVEPGQAYELRFAAKSERLSTDRGPYVEVRGMECPGFRAASPEITGTRGWGGEALSFEVPDGCRVVRVAVRRDESLKFDNKIAGDFWIDDVEIVQRRSQP